MPARFHRLLALLWIVLAVALSEWGLEHWFGPDGAEALPRARVPLALGSLCFVSLAVATWRLGDRRVVQRLNIGALSLIVAGPILGEAALRLSFRFEGSPTRQPIRFAHNLIDDDYWILSGRWDAPEERIEPNRIHTGLGWSQGWITAENPFGLIKRTRDQLCKDGRPKVLFYGDSYVAGLSREENWIPIYLDDRIAGADVVHLGVGGYGTGQAHLLFEATHDQVERPFVIMGIMVYDFDRATLDVRSYQKPRFKTDSSGALEVVNLPIETDPNAYFRDVPLSLRSFVAAALVRRLFPLADPIFAEKVAVNRAIIAANRELATESGSDLLYVLFHPLAELLETDFRSTFFVEELEAQGIQCFDTRGPLLAYIEETGIDPGELYVNGHHNDRGNNVVAEALLPVLNDLGFR